MNKHQPITLKWSGIDSTGKRIYGKSVGYSEQAILKELENDSIKIFKSSKKFISLSIFEKIRKKDIVYFTSNLSALMEAKIPLVEAFNILLKDEKKLSLKILLQTVKKNIATGKSFHESLSDYPFYFNSLFINLIKVGEYSGTLEIILKRLANHFEKTEWLKKKITKALYYPLTILMITFVISSFLLIFIVPQFESIFKSFNCRLPFFTAFVIKAANIYLNYWYYLLSTLFTIIMFLRLDLSTRKIKKIFDQLIFALPFCNFFQKIIIARILRTLATGLTASLPLLDALHMASLAANNYLYALTVENARTEIAKGQRMHVAFQSTHKFSNAVIQMIAVGEESGNLETMLEKLATIYEEDVEMTMNNFSKLIEPFIILVLSIIIGSFVIGLYMPIFKLGSIF